MFLSLSKENNCVRISTFPLKTKYLNMSTTSLSISPQECCLWRWFRRSHGLSMWQTPLPLVFRVVDLMNLRIMLLATVCREASGTVTWKPVIILVRCLERCQLWLEGHFPSAAVFESGGGPPHNSKLQEGGHGLPNTRDMQVFRASLLRWHYHVLSSFDWKAKVVVSHKRQQGGGKCFALRFLILNFCFKAHPNHFHPEVWNWGLDLQKSKHIYPPVNPFPGKSMFLLRIEFFHVQNFPGHF